MKTLLRRIKRSLIFRLCKRLCYWAYTPTPEERLKWMYKLGKAQGFKEALKTLPITQVQPKQASEPLEHLHLPPGTWSKLYFEEHSLSHRAAIPSQHEHTYWPAPFDDSWLNSKPPIAIERMTPAEIAQVPTIRDLTPDDDTKESPAIVALIHQEREQRRSAG